MDNCGLVPQKSCWVGVVSLSLVLMLWGGRVLQSHVPDALPNAGLRGYVRVHPAGRNQVSSPPSPPPAHGHVSRHHSRVQASRTMCGYYYLFCFSYKQDMNHII